jgi:tripartite-type tricarboxylate transporter receptor subunit TctC
MNSLTKKQCVALLCTAALTCAAGASRAQGAEYPNHAIKWIVPYLAGTGPDLSARLIAQEMGAALKQPVIVENKAGAGSNLGVQIAARSPADGYTWLYSGTPMAANMRIYRNPGFNALTDFVHIGRTTRSDSVILVNSESGIASVNELLERLRKNPGKLFYASGGVGSPSHLGAELLLTATGTQAVHVPFKGASESTNAVAGKQVDFTLALVGAALPFIQSNKLRPLAVLASSRNAVLAGVPTLAEAGVPGVTVVSYGGLSVPRGTPPPIVEKIRAALAAVLAKPDLKTRIEATGASLVSSTPAEYLSGLRSEIALTERLMKTTGIEAQ